MNDAAFFNFAAAAAAQHGHHHHVHHPGSGVGLHSVSGPPHHGHPSAVAMADARGWAAAVAGMRPLSHHHQQQHNHHQQHHQHQQSMQQLRQHQMSCAVGGCPQPSHLASFSSTASIVHPTSLARVHHPGLMFAGAGGGCPVGAMPPLGPLSPAPPTPPHHGYGMVGNGASGVISNGSGSPISASNCCSSVPPPSMYQSPSMTSYCAIQQHQQQQLSMISIDADQLVAVYGSGSGSSSSSSTSSSIATATGTPVGGSLDPGVVSTPSFDDSWRGSSIAELRRKALEHTTSMSGMTALESAAAGYR